MSYSRSQAKLDKIREDYAYPEHGTPEEQKAWEISWCWEQHNDLFEEWDWTLLHDYEEECEEMWEEYEASHLLLETYYRKAYRFEPLPDEIRRWLRNDGVADYEELYALED